MENGVRKAPERNLTADDLEVSLTKRPSGGYNEWVIRDYIILGIFAAPPFRVSKLAHLIHQGGVFEAGERGIKV